MYCNDRYYQGTKQVTSFLRFVLEEVEILLAAKGFHQLLSDLLDEVDQEWLSKAEGRMRPGGRIDLESLGQAIFFEQFRSVLAAIWCWLLLMQ